MLPSFSEALAASEEGPGLRHLLLGNGFSMAYDYSSFAYGRLVEEADFSQISVDAQEIFRVLGTADFEKIIEALRLAALLLELYAPGVPALAAALSTDADRLKSALAEVLARKHPDNVGLVTPDEYSHVRPFLANFERIYTVNYDLLLYWATMQDGPEPVPTNDGFAESEEEPGADWVAWQPMATWSSQRIFYLHGALHLFDAGTELRKITWTRTGMALVDQIRDALVLNIYPLVVTEGTSAEKYDKILHSAYLNHALRSFSSIQGKLFIFGLSLAPNDEHILRRIEDGKVSRLFVGLHGDPNSEVNQQIVERADLMIERRDEQRSGRGLPDLQVEYFDSGTADVWRATS